MLYEPDEWYWYDYIDIGDFFLIFSIGMGLTLFFSALFRLYIENINVAVAIAAIISTAIALSIMAIIWHRRMKLQTMKS